MNTLAATWWGHSSVTIELEGQEIVLDPVFVDQLWHLRRLAPSPPSTAAHGNIILISHLHGDHLHVSSLRRFERASTIVAPKGAKTFLRGFENRLVEVSPGDHFVHENIEFEVLAAHHDGRRRPGSTHVAPAIGFRVAAGSHSFWYPGDTGLHEGLDSVAPVDLAVIPIGGWGPSLGDEHFGPQDAAEALTHIRARWALPVHYGTFWPLGLRRIHGRSYRELFLEPLPRFVDAVAAEHLNTTVIAPKHGERVVFESEPG